MKFIKKKPELLVFHFIIDSFVHFAMALCEIVFKSRLQSSSTFFNFYLQHSIFCSLTLVDGFITFFGAIFATKNSVFANSLISTLLCVFEITYIFCTYRCDLSFLSIQLFPALVVLGMAKIGHYWIFLRRYKKMLAQQAIYRIALQRYAEQYGISIEKLAEQGKEKGGNNFV